MPVIELTVVPPSLIASLAMCECASMSPGETNWPVVSMISAPAGIETFAPTAAIFPSRRTTVPFGIVPFVTVSTVPPRSATTRACAAWLACPCMRLGARGAQNEQCTERQKRQARR